MRRFTRFTLILTAFMAGFRWLPGLAHLWQEDLALPILGILHRRAAAFPFPLLEPLAMILMLVCLSRRGRALALALILGMYGLLWYPAYFASEVPVYDPPDDDRLEAVCLTLVDALNASDLRFGQPFDTAGEVAGLPWAGVKPARYPEWMRALGISGLFVPWTGEALVDGDAPPEYLPFTCVHELMHLKGVADEGAANIEAFKACLKRGGMYADSARLWALRYGLTRLDAPARARVTRRMADALPPMLRFAGQRDPGLLPRLLGIGRMTSDYDALLDWLSSNFD